MKNTYITTSIAYVNAEPHIGFLYELLAADVLKRHHQSLGEEVFFLTGTDEHGIKVAQAAEKAGLKPQEYTDQVSKKFENLKEDFNINFDYFVRTTDDSHKKFVQAKWQQLEQAGVLKKKKYIGLYCSGCESFKAEAEIDGGRCTIHEKELEKIEEENWFFLIDEATKGKIESWIKTAVHPENRQQEAINVLRSGAYDEFSVSRSKERYGWGIEVPGDESQIMYVWTDALFNYISALEKNNNIDLWPADIQVIGKDILKFHAIIWPALLIATGYELPKKLLVHGFINVDGKKMSKSLGNVISPQSLLDKYGLDASRYLIFRQLSFFEDSNFTWEDFDNIYNGELANGLGNLVARSIGLAKKFDLKHVSSAAENKDETEEYSFQTELEKANSRVTNADKIITEHKLWEGIENDVSKQEKLAEVFQIIEQIAQILNPFMPETSQKILEQIKTLGSSSLFPRLDK